MNDSKGRYRCGGWDLGVKTDDLLKAYPERIPARPKVGIAPKITDAELIVLAVMQALLGHTSERRWLRYARKNLIGMFPELPGQSGYNKGTPQAGRHDELAHLDAGHRHHHCR